MDSSTKMVIKIEELDQSNIKQNHIKQGLDDTHRSIEDSHHRTLNEFDKGLETNYKESKAKKIEEKV